MPEAQALTISGIVVAGLGRGGHFISLDWVSARLAELMGAAPYPGTLNLRVAPEMREALFSRRTQFAAVMAPDATSCPGYLVEIQLVFRSDVPPLAVWAILPELTVHDDVLEIVSPHCLRERMALQDGDRVTIHVAIP